MEFEGKQESETRANTRYIIGHIKYSNKIPPFFYTFTGSFLVQNKQDVEESVERK